MTYPQPTLYTARTELRPWTAESAARFLAEAMTDPQVTQFLPGQMLDSEALERRFSFEARSRQWAELGYGGWAVYSRDTDHLIGSASIELEGWPEPYWGVPELSTHLVRAAWGGRYAPETVVARMDWAFGIEVGPNPARERPLEQFYGVCLPDHKNSQRLMWDIGMIPLEDASRTQEMPGLTRDRNTDIPEAERGDVVVGVVTRARWLEVRDGVHAHIDGIVARTMGAAGDAGTIGLRGPSSN